MISASFSCLAQQPNTANTNFTNGLEASKFLNLPLIVSTPPVGLKSGSVAYSAPQAKLATWNGTSWIYYLTELNANNTYVPLTRTLTINGISQTLAQDRSWNIPVPAQFNPIAGTNVTLSGTYPNITFNSTTSSGGGGTVTSFSKTDGFGILSSVTNPTTTPNYTSRVDTSNVRTVANSQSLSQLQTRFNLKQNDFIINVQDYGVIGDSSTNNTVALKNILALAKAKGAFIYFPNGSYLVTDTINITYPCTLIGSGNSKIIQTTGNKSLFVVKANYVFFDNLIMDNTAASVTSGSAIKFLINSHECRINDCSIFRFYDNVKYINGSSFRFTNNLFYDPVNTNLTVQNIGSPDEGDSFISNCSFYAGAYLNSTHIKQLSSGGLKIVNCKFNATSLNYPDYCIDVQGQGSTSVLLVQNNSFEGFGASGLRVRVSSGVTFNNVTFSNNQLSSYTGIAKHFVQINGTGGTISNVNIQGNDMLASSTARSLIYINTVSNVSVSGNNYNISKRDSIVNSNNVSFIANGDFILPKYSDGFLKTTSGIVGIDNSTYLTTSAAAASYSPLSRTYTLQQVTTAGNSTTDDIISNSLGLFYRSDPNSRSWSVARDLNAFGDFGVGVSTTRTGNTYDYSRLYINPSGNIGIGTISPSERLSVNGKATVSMAPTNPTDVVRLQDLSSFGGGTVTSFSKTDGFGIISSITNPTTTPNISLSTDTTSLRTVSNSFTKAQSNTNYIQNQVAVSQLGNGFNTAGSGTVAGTMSIGTINNMTGNAPIFLTRNGTNNNIESRSASGVLLDIGAAPATRQILAGLGLTGGGTLTANRTLAADTTVLRTVANSNTLAQLQTRFNAKQNTVSLTTTGSGAATFNSSTGALNIPNSSPDLTGYEVIANKQNSLTADASNLKYPTVTATNVGLALKANLTGGNTFRGVQRIQTDSDYEGLRTNTISYTGLLGGLQAGAWTFQAYSGGSLVNSQTLAPNYNVAGGTAYLPFKTGTLETVEKAIRLVNSDVTIGVGDQVIEAGTGCSVVTLPSTVDANIRNGRIFTIANITGTAISLVGSQSIIGFNGFVEPFETISVISPSTGGGSWKVYARYSSNGDARNYNASGNGSSTSIVIPHGRSGITSASKVLYAARNAASAGISYYTVDATNVTLVYTVAPVSGTNNLNYTLQVIP